MRILLARTVTLCCLIFGLLLSACDSSEQDDAVPSATEQVRQLHETGHTLSDEAHAMLLEFLAYLPAEVVTCAEADVSDDGRGDLIVVYGLRSAPDNMFMCVVFGQDKAAKTGIRLSNVMPAPIENQRITFRNIDKKSPLEFIVMGSKGIYSGFAIYRVTDGVVEDLFDDGMEGCC